MSDSYEFLKAQKDAILADRKKEHDAPFLERIAQLERELVVAREVILACNLALTVFQNRGQWPQGVDVESLRVLTAEAVKGGA